MCFLRVFYLLLFIHLYFLQFAIFTVRQLSCRGGLLVITSDAACISPWMDTARRMGVPVIRLTSAMYAPCTYPEIEDGAGWVEVYPAATPINEVLTHVFTQLEWTEVIVIYDGSLGKKGHYYVLFCNCLIVFLCNIRWRDDDWYYWLIVCLCYIR